MHVFHAITGQVPTYRNGQRGMKFLGLRLTSNIRGLFIGVSTTIYSRSEAGQIQVQLEALLEETVAYRSFFLRADLDRLV